MTSSTTDPHDDVYVLLVSEVLWPDLVAWLNRRGLHVGQLPPDLRVTLPATALPTYITSPTDELMAFADALDEVRGHAAPPSGGPRSVATPNGVER